MKELHKQHFSVFKSRMPRERTAVQRVLGNGMNKPGKESVAKNGCSSTRRDFKYFVRNMLQNSKVTP